MPTTGLLGELAQPMARNIVPSNVATVKAIAREILLSQYPLPGTKLRVMRDFGFFRESALLILLNGGSPITNSMGKIALRPSQACVLRISSILVLPPVLADQFDKPTSPKILFDEALLVPNNLKEIL